MCWFTVTRCLCAVVSANRRHQYCTDGLLCPVTHAGTPPCEAPEFSGNRSTEVDQPYFGRRLFPVHSGTGASLQHISTIMRNSCAPNIEKLLCQIAGWTLLNMPIQNQCHGHPGGASNPGLKYIHGRMFHLPLLRSLGFQSPGANSAQDVCKPTLALGTRHLLTSKTVSSRCMHLFNEGDECRWQRRTRPGHPGCQRRSAGCRPAQHKLVTSRPHPFSQCSML